jgi:hypothetical protein
MFGLENGGSFEPASVNFLLDKNEKFCHLASAERLT